MRGIVEEEFIIKIIFVVMFCGLGFKIGVRIY